MKSNKETWVGYDENRVCKWNERGTVVCVKPADYVPVPLFCLLCEYPIQTLEDVLSVKECESCESCKLRFGKKIKEGGIHSIPRDTAWEEYLDLRQSRFRPTITLK